jgi:hypothetical protein
MGKMGNPFAPSKPILSDEVLRHVERLEQERTELESSPHFAAAMRAMVELQRIHTSAESVAGALE